ncbi:MAG TPA: hypothetical protein DCZ75_17580 [Geobacter sp.]|nr:hypothetical protein [Geobacter sp.]
MPGIAPLTKKLTKRKSRKRGVASLSDIGKRGVRNAGAMVPGIDKLAKGPQPSAAAVTPLRSRRWARENMMDRKKQLEDLLRYRMSPKELRDILADFPWDSDEELVLLERQHVTAVLKRYLRGEISSKEVEDWANVIECREDIGYEEIADVVHLLANPAITEELTETIATQLIAELEEPDNGLIKERRKEKIGQMAPEQDYREIVRIIKTALNEWDPYDLIQSGAPDDEFTEEAIQIAAKVKKTESPAELAQVISDIFSRNFESDLFQVEACSQVASRIFGELEALHLLK